MRIVTMYKLEGSPEPFELTQTTMSDMVAFERHFGLPASVMDMEFEPVLDADGTPRLDPETGEPMRRPIGEFRIEWICFTIWRDARRHKHIASTVEFDDDFLDMIGDVYEVTVDDAPESAEDPSMPVPESVS